jgi:hypothetical protein
VPEVYWICAGSPGATSGSAPAGSGPAANSASPSDVDHLADRGDGQRDLGGDLGHRVAAVAFHHEEAGGARLLEHEPQLARFVRRIRGDQRQPGERRGVHQHHPFRQVGRPDRNPLARPVAREQGEGEALGLGQ